VSVTDYTEQETDDQHYRRVRSGRVASPHGSSADIADRGTTPATLGTHPDDAARTSGDDERRESRPGH